MDWTPYAIGGALRPDSFSSMSPAMQTNLFRFLQAADEALGPGLQVYSGYRSPELQAQLWNNAAARYPDPEVRDNWVARPGHSYHNKGLAADLKFDGVRLDQVSPEVRNWVLQNASAYGLDVPLANEPWQVELAGARDGTVSTKGGDSVGLTMRPQRGILAQQEERLPLGERIKAGAQDGRLWDALAVGFNGMRLNPDPGVNQMVQARAQRRDDMRKEGEANTQRTETLRRLQGAGAPPEIMALAYENPEAGAAAFVRIRQAEQQAASDPNVQSSAALPGARGVMMTMRDGSVQVVTAGGEALTGQAALDFVDESQRLFTDSQRDLYQAREVGRGEGQAETGAAVAGARAAGSQAIDMAGTAWEQAGRLGSSIGTIDEAIAALDAGARAGAIDKYLPNISEASARLQNAMDRMGLDVISATTFGALSEGELRLAMETAVPRNLDEPQLREWLSRRREAQLKTMQMLQDAAAFLSRPDTTLADWIENNKSSGSGGSSGDSLLSPEDRAALGLPAQ